MRRLTETSPTTKTLLRCVLSLFVVAALLPSVAAAQTPGVGGYAGTAPAAVAGTNPAPPAGVAGETEASPAAPAAPAARADCHRGDRGRRRFGHPAVHRAADRADRRCRHGPAGPGPRAAPGHQPRASQQLTAHPGSATTVVLAAWDAYAGATLDDALESLLSQSATARIVVVDNASDVEIAERPGVEVVRSPRRLVLGDARNLGLQHVRSEYVVVWDADDRMLPGTLEILERAIAADPRLAAFGAAILEAPDGTRHRWPRPWLARLLPRPALVQAVQCVWSVFPSTGATIMRTALVRDAGGYPATASGEDWALGVSLAFRGRLGWTERPGRLYRRDPQSVWARNSDARHLRAHAREVRRRIGEDRGIAGWARAARPLIAALQHGAILLSRLRARRGSAGSGSDRSGA